MMTTIKINSKEIKRFNEEEKRNHENIFMVLTDIKGDKYLIAHGIGGYVIADDGIGRTPSQTYARLVKLSKLKNGEHLNIACCFGGDIDNDSENVTIVNNESAPLFITRQVLNNGMGRLTMFTKTKLSDRVKAAISVFI